MTNERATPRMTTKSSRDGGSNVLIGLNTQDKVMKAVQKQTRASSTTAAPSTPESESSQPLIERMYIPNIENTNENMTGRGKNEGGSLRNSRDRPNFVQDPRRTEPQYPTIPDDRRPHPLSESPFGIPQITSGPAYAGYGQAPQPGAYGATPFPTTQPYTQDSRAFFHPQPSSADQFEDDFRSRKPNRPENRSRSPGLVPATVESRQGSSMR